MKKTTRKAARAERWMTIALCGSLTACAATSEVEDTESDAAALSGEPCGAVIESETIPMPAGVLGPRNAGFVPDGGSGVIFRYTDASTSETEIGYILPDGSGFRCLSCAPAFGGLAKPVPAHAFGDGKRFLLQSGDNDSTGQTAYYVAECAPSIAACDDVSVLPITGFPGGIKLQDRVPKISPDGSTLVWTRIRPDGYFMLAGPLVKGAQSYTVGDVRVLNPPGASGTAGALSAASAWYEAKSVSYDGTTLAFAGTLGDSLNLDWFLMDLASGEVRRLTRDADWDEGGQMFPGGRYMTGGRTPEGNVMASLSALPRPPLFDRMFIGAVMNYYLPRGDDVPVLRPKRSRLVPHLLDLSCPDTDAGATALSSEDEGWIGDGAGGNTWSRDGRRFIAGERREEDEATSRLRVGTIVGAPENVAPPGQMVIPSWAPRLSDLPSALAPIVQHRTLAGPAGGKVEISFLGDMLAGEFVAEYHKYSADGCSTLDGTQEATVLSPLAAHVRESLVLSGCETGSSDVDVVFADAATHGHARSERNGEVLERSFGLASP